jgi:hypothetical protein
MNPISGKFLKRASGREAGHLSGSRLTGASGSRTLASRRKEAERCRSIALVITLVLVVLITVTVIIFLSAVKLDRQATDNYAKAIQADSIALGGLDRVISQLQAEIADPANSTTNGIMYVPKNNSNAVPQRMFSLLPVVTYSGTNVYSNAANFASLGNYTTNASLNNRVVSMARWYQPQLTLTTNGFPTPQWILVTRGGTFPNTWSSSLANNSLGNGTCVIGRYAYVVYDTSGLIDVNVAGYPTTAAASAANKGSLPWADLTQLTSSLNQTDVNNLVNWRNAASSGAYAAYITNWSASGFMQVAPGDTTFLSRQELIKYAQTQNPDLTNALPYLTTFSRELNGPTWGPETNMGPVNGNNFNYQTLATNTGSFNPLIYNALVKTPFIRDNGVPAVVGEPLVKYRFPLDKLALLEKMQGTGTLSTTDVQQIQQYFGLDVASDVTASSGFYRHWNYPTTNSLYVHNVLSGTTGIMSLDDVATESREPDFFELLQAGILQGSLGVYSGYQAAASLKAHARSDILQGNGSATYLNGLAITDIDSTKTYQILRIGANIIDQWHADNYPTAITYSSQNSSQNMYGICDLPYITALFLSFYAANMTAGTATPPGIYICPQLWNPHQPSGAANTPTQFQIAPDPGDEWNVQYFAPGMVSFPNGAIFKYNGNTGTFPNPTPTNATAVDSAPFAATNTIVFTASSSSYRDPSMITNATYGNAANPWNPTNPKIGAIQIDNLPMPDSPDLDSSDPASTNGYYTTNSIANAQPTNSAPHGPTQLSWAQATNTLNYPSFSVTNSPPIYQFDFGMNGVFVLEYYNPANATYYPYSTFEGFANSALSTGYSFGASGEKLQTSSTSVLTHADVWVKSDPRTFRFGPGRSTGPSAPYLSIFPTTSLATNLVNQAAPFASGTNTPTGSYPYRLDMWAVNDPGNTAIQGQAAAIPTTNVAYYTDPDGAYRYGDSHYSYNTSAGFETPFQTNQTTFRPVILHRPFRSVGELGYVFRDDPWRTLDLFSPGSADAGLLDLFTLSDGQTVIQHNGQRNFVTAGRVNPNTPYPQVLAAMMVGATQNIAGNTYLSTNNAFNLATNLVMLSSSAPIVNRADLVTRFMTNAVFSSGSPNLYLKGDREAVIRSLAESSNTRTWNFLIDIDAQSGIYPSAATALNNFVVEGERHYWLHIAIDRYTGQVIDRQLETVNQ